MKDLKEIKSYRLDGIAKVTGDAVYVNDRLGKSLVGYVVTSTVAHGIINNIDITEATKLTVVEKIISAKDVK